MRVRVPGKLVLVGEYAVVDGGPAVVAAVDRGVEAAYRPGPGFEVTTPTDDRFARAALVAAGAPAGAWTFRDWNPVVAPVKVGLGGSAAAVVAATALALAARGEPVSPGDLRRRATAVHRAVQGSGSGVDVAASAHGGVLAFEGDTVRPLAVPGLGDRLVVVFSGQAAATGPRVERYRAWTGRAGFVAESRAVAEGFVADPVGATRAAFALLAGMATAAGVDYRTPAIDSLVASAAEAGGAAKPSGAGGGDVVLGVFPDAAHARVWAAEVARRFLVIPVAIAPGPAFGPADATAAGRPR